MDTHIACNEDLLNRAQQLCGLKTKKDTIQLALSEFIERHEQLQILHLFGTIDYVESWNYKEQRKAP